MTSCARRATICLCVVAAACGCGTDGSPTTPAPVPGDLTLSLATPFADDRALLLTLSGPGPISGVKSVSSGYYVQARGTETSQRVAIFGRLVNGPVIRFSVPDVAESSQYLATLQEAADPQNNLRPSVSGYAFTVSR